LDNELVIKSWSDLQEKIFEGTWNEEINRYRGPYVYRGLSHATYLLETSLMRLGGPYARLEKHLIRNFKKYAYKRKTSDSIWDWLAIAQHHGLPTRMMDWTYSPYIALHYATINLDHFNVDGAVWCVDYVELAKLLPNKLKVVLSDEGSNVFTADMLDSVINSLKAFDEIDSQPFIIFLEPPSLDERIVNQFALFSLISDPEYLMNDYLEKHPGLYKKIIVPAELKWEIRDKLDQANITERVLFPGLDGLSMWLKRHYSPKT